MHAAADQYLVTYAGTGSDRPYAYLLVDHLRWLDREELVVESVAFADLGRYMGALGAKVARPLGVPWRSGRRPYGVDKEADAKSAPAQLGHATEQVTNKH